MTDEPSFEKLLEFQQIVNSPEFTSVIERQNRELRKSINDSLNRLNSLTKEEQDKMSPAQIWQAFGYQSFI